MMTTAKQWHLNVRFVSVGLIITYSHTDTLPHILYDNLVYSTMSGRINISRARVGDCFGNASDCQFSRVLIVCAWLVLPQQSGRNRDSGDDDEPMPLMLRSTQLHMCCCTPQQRHNCDDAPATISVYMHANVYVLYNSVCIGIICCKNNGIICTNEHVHMPCIRLVRQQSATKSLTRTQNQCGLHHMCH